MTARTNEDRQPAEAFDAPAPRRSRQPVKPEQPEAGSGLTTRKAAPRTPSATAPRTRAEPAAAEPFPVATEGAAAPAPVEDLAPAAAPAAATEQGPEVASPAAPVPAAAEPRRPQILVLDDEPSIRAFLGKALAQAGMECRPAQDGHAALEMLRDVPFDAMLIDHRMAGMNGTQFYEAAVEFKPGLADRAIFMSGDVVNPELRGFATQRGIRLLQKPFDLDALVRIVREVLAAANEAAAPSGGATSGATNPPGAPAAGT